jgi:cell division transport system permease protein
MLSSVLRETGLNIRGRSGNIAVTFLMVSLSFVVFDAFLLVTWNLRAILEREREAVGIELFLSPATGEAEARALADRISMMEGVRSVYYVSPAEAEAVFRAELPDEVGLLELMGTGYSLPASLQISLAQGYTSAGRVAALATAMSGLDGVSEAVYGEDYLPGLSRLLESLHRLDVITGTILLLSVSLVVAGAIRLSISARSRTVELLDILGASDTYLKAPFLLEGLMTGLCASAGGLAFTALLSLFMAGAVTHVFLPARWIAGVLLLGAASGLAGSWIGLGSGIPGPRR